MKPSSIITLKREARRVAVKRGHNMMNFETTKSGERAVSRCVYCNMEAEIIRNPRPNEISIGGEAIALQCKRAADLFTLPPFKPERFWESKNYNCEFISCGG